MLQATPDKQIYTLFQVPCPQQTNAIDCGVFVCSFMKEITAGVNPLYWTQERIPYFRQYMLRELATETCHPQLEPEPAETASLQFYFNYRRCLFRFFYKKNS